MRRKPVTALFRRVSRGALGGLALGAAAAAIALWQLGGQSAGPPAAPSVKAKRGDLVVSVRGVGRIVESGPAGQITGPGAATSAASGTATSAAGSVSPASGGGAPSGPADGVFARAAGRVSKLLVAPGRHVVVGEPLAMLDDGGTAAAAVRRAENDLAAAQLELRQKRTSDPLMGLPPSAAELAAARFSVTSARDKLALLRSPPRPADVGAARYDLRKSEADLETLRGGTPAARAQALGLARRNVLLGRQRLIRLLAPPNNADVGAAELEVRKAEADLAALQRPTPPTTEAIAAARQTLEAARLKLGQVTGSPDPVAVAAARQELAQAESSEASLQQVPPPPSQQALDAARLAVEAARLKLGQVTGSPDPVAVAAARVEYDRAIAELAALQRPQPPAREAVAAAHQAVTAAKLKLVKLRERLPPADITAARLELQKAQLDARTLEAGPGPAALAATRQSVTAARARLGQVLDGALPADVIGARLDVRKAEADLAVLRARGGPASPADVGLAQLKAEAARARLRDERFAQQQLTVRSPWRGTVTSVLTRPGAPVDPATPVATVAALSNLEVSVDLSEFDVARVKRSLPALVGVDALGGKAYAGRVLFAALSGVDNGGVVTYPVRVTLGRVAGLKPGMNVSVRIIVAKRRNVVRVPLEAVSGADGDHPSVRVVDGLGHVHARAVALGLSNNKDVEITRGLRAGERVLFPVGGGV